MARLEDRKVRALERIADALEQLGIGEQPVDEKPKRAAQTGYSGPVMMQTPAARTGRLDDDPAAIPMSGNDAG